MAGGFAVIGTPAHTVEGPLWRHLAQAPAPASIWELHAATDAHPNSIDHRLRCWMRAGFVTHHPGRPTRYAMTTKAPRTSEPPRVTIDGSVRPRPRPTRDKLWTAIRVLRDFDLPILRMTTGTTHPAVMAYVGLLQQVGFVRLIKPGSRHTGEQPRYRLVRNPGPAAPRICTQGQGRDGHRRWLLDPNSGERHEVTTGSPSHRRRYRKIAPADGGVG